MDSSLAGRRRSIRATPISLAAQELALDASTGAVQRMYQCYPYPSPQVGKGILHDESGVVQTLFPDSELAGWHLLEAGCGTGHRLVALAKRFPKARITAVDMTEASLGVATRLAAEHGVTNVQFRQANLLDMDLGAAFDLIVSWGVVHHFSSPSAGLRNLCRHLGPKGLICIWLYHPYGEFDRLRYREVIGLLTEGEFGLDTGMRVLDELNLRLSTQRYGTRTSVLPASDSDQHSIDVDAYLHPVVNAYRIQEGVELFRGSGVEWVAANGINCEGVGKLLDLEHAAPRESFCLAKEEVLPTEWLQQRMEGLSKEDQLKVIELVLCPTGFNLVAGRGDAFLRASPRIAGNRVPMT